MTAKKQRVAITGIGMVTPIGHNTEATWNGLLAGQSGINLIQSFDASGFPARIAAEVKNFNADDYIKDKKLLRYSMPSTQFALVASSEALADSGIHPTQSTAERWGIVTGSGLMTASFDFMSRFHSQFGAGGIPDFSKLGADGHDFFSIHEFGRTQTNCGLALIQAMHGIKGYSNSVHTACASGGHALGLALQAIRDDEADYILVGGFDSMINPIGVAGFCLLGALATDNDNPQYASRPFNLTRNGFVLGEGAAFLVLEKLELAQKRKARIYAELAGEGNTLSSYRITDSHPSGDGAIQSIEQALTDAQVNKEDVEYINAHGTSTKMNDFSETNAIKAVFEQRAYQIPVSSTKSLTGHLISAAGALEGAFCAIAIHKETVPMTANLDKADPDCDLDYVTEGVRNRSIKVAVSNSFGFGGSNSCLVFKKVD